jgi:hypothetical protein
MTMGRYRRVNITLPIELIDQLPEGLNVSGACAEALAARVACDHRRLRCVACGLEHDRLELVASALREFFLALMWDLDHAVRRCLTAEAAARIVRDVAERRGVERAAQHPIHRPTRKERAWAEHEQREQAA